MQLRAAEQRLLTANAERWLGDLALRLHLLRHPTFGFASQLPPGAVEQPPRPFRFDPLSAHNPWRFTRGLLVVELLEKELPDLELAAWFASPLAAWVEEASVSVAGIDTLEGLVVPRELQPYLGVGYAFATARDPEQLTEWHCEQLLKCTNFSRVRALTVYPRAIAAGFVQLMANADVSGLRWLTVKAPEGDTWAAFLADAPLTNLSALDISGCELGPTGM